MSKEKNNPADRRLSKELIMSARNNFNDLIIRNFSHLTLYSFLAGKIAHGVCNFESDIDCILVLNKQAERDSDIVGRIKKFSEGYIKIHSQLGHQPDLDFPGDVLTIQQKEAAIEGRGFSVKGQLGCAPITTESDWDGENTDYRVWLTELAFNNNCFILGDLRQFKKDSDRATDTVIRFLLLTSGSAFVSVKSLTQKILSDKSFLGFSKNYGDLGNYIQNKIEASFVRLLAQGYIKSSLESLSDYLINSEILNFWKNEVISNSKKKVSYLISWSELRKHVALLQQGRK